MRPLNKVNSHLYSIMGILFHNKVEETLAGSNVAVMKGIRVPDTFCESRLGFLPGHGGESTLTPTRAHKKHMVCCDISSPGIKAFLLMLYNGLFWEMN